MWHERLYKEMKTCFKEESLLGEIRVTFLLLPFYSKSFRLKYLICQGTIFGGSLSWSPSRASEKKKEGRKEEKKEKAGRKEGKKKVGKHLLSDPAAKLGVIKIY